MTTRWPILNRKTPARVSWLAVRAALIALSLLMFAVPACSRPDTSPGQTRNLQDFQPHLTARLTPALARAQFGPPDEETGSGLRIYI